MPRSKKRGPQPSPTECLPELSIVMWSSYSLESGYLNLEGNDGILVPPDLRKEHERKVSILAQNIFNPVLSFSREEINTFPPSISSPSPSIFSQKVLLRFVEVMYNKLVNNSLVTVVGLPEVMVLTEIVACPIFEPHLIEVSEQYDNDYYTWLLTPEPEYPLFKYEPKPHFGNLSLSSFFQKVEEDLSDEEDYSCDEDNISECSIEFSDDEDEVDPRLSISESELVSTTTKISKVLTNVILENLIDGRDLDSPYFYNMLSDVVEEDLPGLNIPQRVIDKIIMDVVDAVVLKYQTNVVDKIKSFQDEIKPPSDPILEPIVVDVLVLEPSPVLIPLSSTFFQKVNNSPPLGEICMNIAVKPNSLLDTNKPPDIVWSQLDMEYLDKIDVKPPIVDIGPPPNSHSIKMSNQNGILFPNIPRPPSVKADKDNTLIYMHLNELNDYYPYISSIYLDKISRKSRYKERLKNPSKDINILWNDIFNTVFPIVYSHLHSYFSEGKPPFSALKGDESNLSALGHGGVSNAKCFLPTDHDPPQVKGGVSVPLRVIPSC